MNVVLNTIFTRRAVRNFKDQAVDLAIINQLIEAGKMAPSALNQQPWKFYILTDSKLIKVFSNKISGAVLRAVPKLGFHQIKTAIVSYFHKTDFFKVFKSDDKIFHAAPVVIFITSPKENEWAGLDIGMCTQNMMLAAKSLGLDSCPVGLGKFVEQTDIYERLGIPDGDHVQLAVVFGYGDEAPEAKVRKMENVFFVR